MRVYNFRHTDGLLVNKAQRALGVLECRQRGQQTTAIIITELLVARHSQHPQMRQCRGDAHDFVDAAERIVARVQHLQFDAALDAETHQRVQLVAAQAEALQLGVRIERDARQLELRQVQRAHRRRSRVGRRAHVQRDLGATRLGFGLRQAVRLPSVDALVDRDFGIKHTQRTINFAQALHQCNQRGAISLVMLLLSAHYRVAAQRQHFKNRNGI